MFFNQEFYPTPAEVIERMLSGIDLNGLKVLEPSAGSGNIVKYTQDLGAEVIACENDPELKKILKTLCPIIENDFLDLTSDKISHINLIVMNPPFSKAAEHITHAYEIAPEGCKIIALCNSATIKNDYTKKRQELKTIVESFGSSEDLGDCFSNAQRKTDVEVSLIRINKPGSDYSAEFEGFFMEEEPEEAQANGLISYNLVRDLVNRYVASIKIYDQQLETAARLNEMQANFFNHGKSDFKILVSRGDMPVKRNEFKKDMQRAGWLYIIHKMKLEKYATRQLREDINKFVESQTAVPFTMRNVYKMLEIIVATTGQRMDKVLIEVFDKVTAHHADNRQNLQGWKTNSHYLLTKKFIVPAISEVGLSGEVSTRSGSRGAEMLEDLTKALCYITGKDYDKCRSLQNAIRYPYYLADSLGDPIPDKSYEDKSLKVFYQESDRTRLEWKQQSHPESEIKGEPVTWGNWFEWHFFRIKLHKVGTAHIEFKDVKTWELFNAKVAKLKGYPLPEKKEQTAYQERQNGRKPQQKKSAPLKKAVVLSTIQLKFN